MIKGYTTGTCAQGACKAACAMLIKQEMIKEIEVETPSGVKLSLGLVDQEIGKDFARCAVIKNSGDDPDTTNKAKICAEVRLSDKKGIAIMGGDGVGRVTKPGLAIGVGEWAINPMPKRMIFEEASKFLPKDKGFEITISVPGGEALAKHTYNPRLGIVGGISIIGTTGIVEPKSLDAYKASLALELDLLTAQGYKRAVFVLGYVGEKYCIDGERSRTIKIGDHVGFMLEEAAKRGIKEAMLVGHIGKMIKIANGQFDTHYKFGDGRMDGIARYAVSCGARDNVIADILSQTTAEAAIDILKKNGLMEVFNMIGRAVSDKAKELINNKIDINCVILSLKGEVLA